MEYYWLLTYELIMMLSKFTLSAKTSHGLTVHAKGVSAVRTAVRSKP